mmetsp:Transcript_24305/g.69281  ORF Transcript_24305/g.69281 Transcript_24305/m.69281 type:complete len:232 (+) Transcript_24305:1061-1756(+)
MRAGRTRRRTASSRPRTPTSRWTTWWRASRRRASRLCASGAPRRRGPSSSGIASTRSPGRSLATPRRGTCPRRGGIGRPTARRSSRSPGTPRLFVARQWARARASWSGTTSPGCSSTRPRRRRSSRRSSPSAAAACRWSSVATIASCRRPLAPSAPRRRAPSFRSSSVWCGTPGCGRTSWRSSTACTQRSPTSHGGTSTPDAWPTASTARRGPLRRTSHGRTLRTPWPSCR